MKWRTTFFTIDTETARDNPSESFASDATKVAQNIYVVPGTTSSRVTAAAEFLGWPTMLNGTPQAGGKIPKYVSRVTPMPYDSFTNAAKQYFIWATSLVNLRPYGAASVEPGGTGTIAQQAKGTLNFNTLPWYVTDDAAQINPNAYNATTNPLGGLPDEGYWLAQGWTNSRYIVKQLDPGGGKFFTTRPGMLGVNLGGGSAAVIPQGMPIRETRKRATYTWMQVPVEAIPWTAMQLCEGAINSATFDGFPAGTMLLTEPRVRIYNSPFGNKIADITYPFHIAYNVSFDGTNTPRGWNAVFFNNNGTWDYYPMYAVNPTKPVTLGTTQPYRSADMSKLFRPDQP